LQSILSPKDRRIDRVVGVAFDVSKVDPLLAKLNEVYAGTQLFREKMEAWSLLRDMAESFSTGDIAEHELRGYVATIAESVCAQVASAGKPCSPERLAEELFALVKQRAAAVSASRFMAIREKMRAAREKAREKREGLSIL
jgi:5-carboxymethyl-2-hydroxymuconate isomerase